MSCCPWSGRARRGAAWRPRGLLGPVGGGQGMLGDELL